MNAESVNAVTGIRTVAVPVTDQNRAVAFYVDQLGLQVTMDSPMDAVGGRWIELAAPGSETSIALAPAYGDAKAGGLTGIRLTTTDAARLHAKLKEDHVDVDDLLNWPGVPPMFEFRDPDGNGGWWWSNKPLEPIR